MNESNQPKGEELRGTPKTWRCWDGVTPAPCANCGKMKVSLQAYWFYPAYEAGITRTYESDGLFPSATTVTPYRVGSGISVPICDECVDRSRSRHVLGSIAVFLVSGAWVCVALIWFEWWWHSSDFARLAFLGISLLLITAAIWASVFITKGEEELGDQIAVAVTVKKMPKKMRPVTGNPRLTLFTREGATDLRPRL